jgi:aminoglycoside 6-adenylyltransferase
MRSEQAMYELILDTAHGDERIRAVVLSGSRANPQARRDMFQDYDLLFLVTDVAAFTNDPTWIDRFGERMILQLPDTMFAAPARSDGSFAYLMQFTDGNRIDLTLYPLAQIATLKLESLSVVLLDKDQRFLHLPPPSQRDYLPQPPSAAFYADCCNEFWWVAPYVAKGLWRNEIIYAKAMLEQVLRKQLMMMLTWMVGYRTQFTQSVGKQGKDLPRWLEPELWSLFEQTYADADYDRNWEALLTCCELFRRAAHEVAAQSGFTYPADDDARVSAYLNSIRRHNSEKHL